MFAERFPMPGSSSSSRSLKFLLAITAQKFTKHMKICKRRMYFALSRDCSLKYSLNSVFWISSCNLRNRETPFGPLPSFNFSSGFVAATTVLSLSIEGSLSLKLTLLFSMLVYILYSGSYLRMPLFRPVFGPGHNFYIFWPLSIALEVSSILFHKFTLFLKFKRK